MRCLRFTGTGPVDLIAFRVSPIVATTLLGRRLTDLWDQPVSLQDLVGAEATTLLELLHAAARADRVGILFEWVERRLHAWDSASAYAQGLFDALIRRGQRGTIQAVARALGPSGRSLRRTLAHSTGLSPKDVQLSGRLLAACTLLRERADLNVTEIASNVGFYDHAALTHAFSTRLGLSPVAFRSEPAVFYERIDANESPE
jgi:AraC-like DNA-binding protein